MCSAAGRGSGPPITPAGNAVVSQNQERRGHSAAQRPSLASAHTGDASLQPEIMGNCSLLLMMTEKWIQFSS